MYLNPPLDVACVGLNHSTGASPVNALPFELALLLVSKYSINYLSKVKTSNNLPIRFCIFLFVIRLRLTKKEKEQQNGEIRREQPSPSPNPEYKLSQQ